MAEIHVSKQGMLGFGDSFPLNAEQELEDIEFWIHYKEGEKKQFFLILEDEQGLYDIVKLQEIYKMPERRVKVFKVSLDTRLSLSTSRITLRLFELETDTLNQKVSHNSLNIILSTRKFNMHREIHIAEELSNKVKAYYEQIVSMLNILEQEMKQLENEKGDQIQ